MMKNKKAFSIIELIMTILILAVIASASAAFFIPTINLLFYSPSQLMVDQFSEEIIDILIEGDSKAKGLRFAKSITSADEDEITFVNADNDTIIYRWDVTEEKIYRNINAAGEELIPYSYYGGISIKGQASDAEIFKYYNSTPSQLSAPVGTETSIESIRINVVMQSGSGSVKANQGRVEISTGVDIKQFV
ncbi:MAG: prepilin-type N-terminal cleavage/methylation domain-containing protein [Candidatus Omnitrophica bacterium]|nr:prepilin-type N-terminal cleavage/methylation domain-containing protein [Candidatus Omnitrophota bacterium]